MKIIKALNLDKYCDPERYAQHDGFIFRCELYWSNWRKRRSGQTHFNIEVEGENEDSVRTIAGFVGKRVYNYQEGGYIKLGIE